MDATFVFNLLAVLGLGLYTASLLLHIHIVSSDFGHAPEGSFGCGRIIEKRCPGASALVTSAVCLEEVLVVPAADVGHLLDDGLGHLTLTGQGMAAAPTGVSGAPVPSVAPPRGSTIQRQRNSGADAGKNQ